jgi:hypothetical protein
MACGLIASTLVTLTMRTVVRDGDIDVAAVLVVGLAYVLLRRRRLSPMLVVVACGCAGVVASLVLGAP